MKFTSIALLVAMAFEPAAITAFLTNDEALEFMWCCQDALCFDACAKLCMPPHNKAEFCLDGDAHPNNFDGGKDIEEKFLEFLNSQNGGGGGGGGATTTEVTYPDDTRRLQDDEPHVPITGCGENDQSEAWQQCYFDFFAGNEYSQAHCALVLDIKCCVSGVCGGEPHFKTWTEEWYDYHGECDLTLVHAPSYAHHLGLDIHIRTKRRDAFSFIESAAIKIGNDIIEISGFGLYVLNGVVAADLETAEIGAFKVIHVAESKKIHHFTIDIGEHQIRIKTSKDFVSITLDEVKVADFLDSSGMLGQYGTGTLLGRDGRTVYSKENINEFGQEWQVQPHEPRLFENTERAPQYPAKCLLPEPRMANQRRLGERDVSQEDAEKACAAWPSGHQDKCVYDVMATQDLELADAGSY